MTEDIGWKPIFEFSDHMLRALAGFGLGWLLWQMNGPDWPFFIFFAGCCAVGGAIRLLKALLVLVRLLGRARELGSFRKKGKAPKADRLATEAELKAQGLFR